MNSTGYFYTGTLSNRVVCLRAKSFHGKPRAQSISSMFNLTKNLHFGQVSETTQRKIKKSIQLIIDTAEVKKFQLESNGPIYTFDVNFITLTLPSKQQHNDNVIKKLCLGQFLNEWRQRDNLLKYVWRAEKQVNGNIHFHILSNSFYHYKNIREDWNRIVNKLGYIDGYANSFEGMTKASYIAKFKQSKEDSTKLAIRFEKGLQEGWRNPNSTDVHAISQINDVAAYVAKYCAKASAGIKLEGKEFVKSKVINRNKVKLSIAEIVQIRASSNVVEGRIWGCDQETGRFKPTIFTQFDESFDKIMKVVQENATFTAVKDFITVYYGNFHKKLMQLEDEILSEYQYNISKYLFPRKYKPIHL